MAGQAFAALRGVADGIQQLHLLLVGEIAAQPVHAAADDHQEIVEIVGDAAGQLTDRFQPLRLAQRAFRRLAPVGFLIEPPGPAQRDPQHGRTKATAGRPTISCFSRPEIHSARIAALVTPASA